MEFRTTVEILYIFFKSSKSIYQSLICHVPFPIRKILHGHIIQISNRPPKSSHHAMRNTQKMNVSILCLHSFNAIFPWVKFHPSERSLFLCSNHLAIFLFMLAQHLRHSCQLLDRRLDKCVHNISNKLFIFQCSFSNGVLHY